MKEKSLNAIRDAAVATFSELQGVVTFSEEPYWEYKRGAAGEWQGMATSRPNIRDISRHRELFDTYGGNIEGSLKEDYPEHLKGIGTSMSWGVLPPASILSQLAYSAYERFHSFELTKQQLDELLADVAKFFDRDTVRLKICSPALNISGPVNVPPVIFPNGVTLRPISDEELNDLYGGENLFQFNVRSAPFTFPEFLFIKEIEVPKIIGNGPRVIEPNNFQEQAKKDLELCMLILGTYKDASAVGYDGIRIFPSEFTLGFAFGRSNIYPNEHTPYGRYTISPEESMLISEHAVHFMDIHPTLEMASQRLIDGLRRTKSRDAIVDAIIGLESILLAETGDERYRGEMRFRFSLNYSTLFPKDEKENAFLTARSLYDLRSTIAHGSDPGDKIKIAGNEMTLYEAAALSRALLRKTITFFLPQANKPEFMSERYWISKELGL